MISKSRISLSVADPATVLSTAESVVVANLGYYSIYVGDSDVSPTNGLELVGGRSYSFDLRQYQPLYAISSSPTPSDILILQTAVHDANAAPKNINLAAELGGEIKFVHSAHPVTAVAQLPATPPVGELAQLQIGQFPNVETIDLVCYQDPITQVKYWISDSASLTNQSDQGYMGSNTVADDYIDTNINGTTTGILGWSTRSIRRAAEILAAGLKLQANMTAIIGGSSSNFFTLDTFFFQHNSGDQVIFSADGSTRDAEMAALVSNADNLVRFKSTGWNDVVKKGTNTPIDAVSITKTNLWPRLYGKVSGGIAYGQEIDADLQYRWYIPA